MSNLKRILDLKIKLGSLCDAIERVGIQRSYRDVRKYNELQSIYLGAYKACKTMLQLSCYFEDDHLKKFIDAHEEIYANNFDKLPLIGIGEDIRCDVSDNDRKVMTQP